MPVRLYCALFAAYGSFWADSRLFRPQDPSWGQILPYFGAGATFSPGALKPYFFHGLIGGMSNIIMELSEYLSDKEISEGLHMEADEILRLRHATGYAALYAKHKYNKTWEMKRQVRHRRAYQEEHGPESIPV